MKRGLSLGLLAAVQIVAAFAFQLVVIAAQGAGPATDAFISAQTVPIIVFSVLALPMQSVWQPRLAIASDDSDAASDAYGQAQRQTFVVMAPIAGLLALARESWLPVLFPGLSAAQIRSAAAISVPLLVSVVLQAHAVIATSALRARGRFVAPELTIGLAAVVSVAAAHTTVSTSGVIGAGWVILARSAGITVVLLALTGLPRMRRRRAPTDDWNAWKALRPLWAGSSIYKLSPAIDRYIASHAPPGGMSILALSQTGITGLAQVIERAVTSPAGPEIAQLANRRDSTGLLRVVRTTMGRSAVLALVMGLLLVIAKPWWVQLCGFALKLSPQQAAQMWLLAILFLGFLHVSACGSTVVTAFIALGDARTPVIVSVAAFLAGAALKYGAFNLAGLYGLAAATSAYYLINLLVVWWLLEKRIRNGL